MYRYTFSFFRDFMHIYILFFGKFHILSTFFTSQNLPFNKHYRQLYIYFFPNSYSLIQRSLRNTPRHQYANVETSNKILKKGNRFLMLHKVTNFAKRVWQLQVYRYKKKGLMNILIGCLILYFYFYQLPIIAKQYWPEQIENKVLFQGTVATLILSLQGLIVSLIYLPGYLGAKLYKQFEISPGLSKPWDRESWPSVRRQTIRNLVINFFVINPIYMFTGAYFSTIRYDGFPTHQEIWKHLLIIYFADDFIYTFVHWAFHAYPSLYKYHKVHHEYDSVFSIMAQYCHPVEQLLANLIPGTIVVGTVGVHSFTFILWMIFKLYNTSEGHSGYVFGWSPSRLLPFNWDVSYHEFHHSKNDGNYATSFYIFELLLGFNRSFFKYRYGKQLEAAKDTPTETSKVDSKSS